MAAAAIHRSLHRLSFLLRRRSSSTISNPNPVSEPRCHLYFPLFLRRGLASSSNTNTTASFEWSDKEEEEDEVKKKKKEKDMEERRRSRLPPPYDPFSSSKNKNKEEEVDPSNLQEVFHRMRTDGLTGHAVKMLDALPRDEALRLFSLIKDGGSMPDVVAHTAVIEAYANAPGHSKDALRTFHRMLASGVAPNAYTYAVLIQGLARGDASDLPHARAYLLEMTAKGMAPHAPTYLSVFQAYLSHHGVDEARTLLHDMRARGFAPDENAVRHHLGPNSRSHMFRTIITLLFPTNSTN